MNSAKSQLSAEQESVLASMRAGMHPRLAERAQVVLLSAEGYPAVRVAEQLGITVRTVYKWRQRFQAQGLEGLRDRARPGQPRRLSRQSRDEIVRLTVEELPPEGQRWTIRSVARRLGVTQHQVRKVWSEHAVRPHLGRGSLVDERVVGGRGLRALGLWICPPVSVLAVELDPGAIASPRLLRRVLPDARYPLHQILRSVRPAPSVAVLAAELSSFVAQVVTKRPQAAVHLLFPSRGLTSDPSLAGAISQYPHVAASAKTSLSLWADTVELWLEQTQKQGLDPSIALLRAAMAAFLSRVEKGSANEGEKRPFLWIRGESVPVRSVGSVSVRTADL